MTANATGPGAPFTIWASTSHDRNVVSRANVGVRTIGCAVPGQPPGGRLLGLRVVFLAGVRRTDFA